MTLEPVDKLLICFSGGRTSGYMAQRAMRELAPNYKEVITLFANTGQEDERTLTFVDRCDKAFDLGVKWLEANVTHGERKGTTYKEVNYDTASRKGEPFEEVIKKYGIPNQSMIHCTRELKLQPMRAYVRDRGWKMGDYDQIIGIRADEIDRMSPVAYKQRLNYPLVRWGITKPYVLDWWSKQTFDLNIPEHRGNCVWCWKKSKRKLLTLAKESPEVFDFPKKMEEKYAHVGARAKRTGQPQRFFREDKTVDDIIAMSKEDFDPFVDGQNSQVLLDFDTPNGCSESCEVEYV